MIETGKQIAAARVLLGWGQQDLADAAKLHRRSIQYWERKERIPHGGYREPHAVKRIRQALSEAGVDVFTRPSIGVRLSAAH
jgi:transcriptional regulator with XRE-family HTH domain